MQTPDLFAKAVSLGEAIALGTLEDETPMAHVFGDEDAVLWVMRSFTFEEALTYLNEHFSKLESYEHLISRNVAMCTVCGRMIESVSGYRLSQCACGNLTVGGGLEILIRKSTRPYRELSEHVWAHASQLDELIKKLRSYPRIDHMQERMSQAQDPTHFAVNGITGGNLIHIRLTARSSWEAAQKARALHPTLEISSISQLSVDDP